MRAFVVLGLVFPY